VRLAFARMTTRGTQISSSTRIVPFAHGFRPFFLAALCYALLGIGMWVWIRETGVAPLQKLPPQLWHGHEMLFGFIVAAIAGFLLTAVPSWTSSAPFAGPRLAGLAALWLAGRICFGFATFLPVIVVAAIELLFLPMLALMIAPALIRARNRNTPLLAVLGVLWLIDAIFLGAMAHGDILLAIITLRVGVDIVLLLITVIGGRIVPTFTANALRSRGLSPKARDRRWVDRVTIVSMIVVVAIDAAAPEHSVAAIAAGVCALTQAVRLAGWEGERSLQQPIVWVLHVGYLWLPIGFALKAIYLSTGAIWSSQWLHALTIGAASTMIVAVITRASLGHTARPLAVSRSVAIAYGLLSAATLVRVFGAPLIAHAEWAVLASGALWFAAFALVLAQYAPILLQPRVDGRPG